MKKQETISLLVAARNRLSDRVVGLEPGRDNPQVEKSYQYELGRRNTIEDVLALLRDNNSGWVSMIAR